MTSIDITIECIVSRIFKPFDLATIDSNLRGFAQPYFQPIISIEDRRVIGYEALARGYNQAGEIVSLGHLFHNEANQEKIIELDHYLREEAMRTFIESGLAERRKLFLNIVPQWLNVADANLALEDSFHLLKVTEKYNIPPSSIVLEITEDEFKAEAALMSKVIEFLKSKGFAIAVDDFGSGASNMARIGEIRPSYIKLDLHLMKRGFAEGIFKEILNSMSFLAEKIGAILLVEGIENEEELYGAFDIGARYLQGFFFGLPSDQFQLLETLDEQLNEYLSGFIEKKLNRMKSLLYFKDVVSGFFEVHLQELFVPHIHETTATFKPIAQDKFPDFWRHHLKVVYFLNDQGIQISPNYNLEKKEGSDFIWVEDQRYEGKNWSWRPYFLQFMAQRAVQDARRSYSEPYGDIRSGRSIVTFVHAYDDGVLLCLDFDISHLHDPLWHKELSAMKSD